MRLVQFFVPGKGRRVGLVRGDRVLDISAPEEGICSSLDLIEQGKTAAGLVTRAEWLARRLHRKALELPSLQRTPSRRSPHLLIPIDPPEVWGARITPKCSAEPQNEIARSFHSPETSDHAEDSARPELFFKATASRCVGPNAPVMIRSDARLSATEPELAVVLGASGALVAFTACNDVCARDLERKNPFFLSQSRVYRGSCALGPCLVTADEIGDPYALQVRCSVIRESRTLFSEAVNTARLEHRLEKLVAWLLKDNAIPPGSVLSAGTGLVVPGELTLKDGDRVDIEIQGIGKLSNPVRRLAPKDQASPPFHQGEVAPPANPVS